MKRFSLYKRFLLSCRVFWLYAKARRKVARLKGELFDLKRTAELTEHRYRLREDALIDRVLQAVRLSGVQFAPEDVNNLLNAKVLTANAPDQAKDKVLSYNDLTVSEQNAYLDKKDQFWEWGVEAGHDEAEIAYQWKLEEPNAIAEALGHSADFSNFIK